MCILEFIRYALVGNMPMLVVKRKSLTRAFLPLHFNGVRIVIFQYPFATGRVQHKRVSDSVRNILAGSNFPSLDLEPIAVLLIDNLVMAVKKCTDLVFFRGPSILSDDICVIHNVHNAPPTLLVTRGEFRRQRVNIFG